MMSPRNPPFDRRRLARSGGVGDFANAFPVRDREPRPRTATATTNRDRLPRPRAATAITAALLCLALTPQIHTAELKAGAAMSVITPPIGTVLNGGVGPNVSRYVHDDLHAKALVLDDGTTRLCFLVADLCLLDRPFCDGAKVLIERETGLKAKDVMLSCTHTHSAGSATGGHLVDPDPEYRAWLPRRMVDAVKCAVANLEPAQLAFGRGSLPQHVFCRRLKLREGSTYVDQLGQTPVKAKMNWDSPHQDEIGPAGPVDPEVSFLSIQRANGRPLALLGNYSLHYVGDVGPGHISADYFAAFAERIGELLHAEKQDPPFVGILTNGTSGDINNIDPQVKRQPTPPYTRIRLVAGDLAREVHRGLKGLQHRGDVALAASLAELKVATRRPSAEEVEKARAVVRGRPVSELSGWIENSAREQIILSEYPAEVSIPLQGFRIGEVTVAGWPGEIFASSGLELKARSPAKPLFNIGLANGWFGYIPPPEQHDLGAYETWRMRTSFLERDATVKMLDRFVKLIEELR